MAGYDVPSAMHVEKLKYIIWAADLNRAVGFYRTVFDAEVKAGVAVDWDNIFAEEATAEPTEDPVQP